MRKKNTRQPTASDILQKGCQKGLQTKNELVYIFEEEKPG